MESCTVVVVVVGTDFFFVLLLISTSDLYFKPRVIIINSSYYSMRFLRLKTWTGRHGSECVCVHKCYSNNPCSFSALVRAYLNLSERTMGIAHIIINIKIIMQLRVESKHCNRSAETKLIDQL